LPESIECVNYTTRFNCGNNKANQKHGSACAEILHDVAPGIDTLYLYAFRNEVDIASIVDHMIANGVDVASMSWSWLNGEPYDGSGFVSAQVNRASENGIFWAVSAGNQRERHYEAYFDPGDCSEGHDFDESDGCGNLNSLGWQGENDVVCIWLEWNDWPETDQDYDLRIFRDNGGEPLNLPDLDFLQGQDGDDPPTEGGCFRAPTADTYYFLVDQHDATSNHYFEVFSRNDDFGQVVQESSIPEPATADGAISTAAFPATDITALEDFSSMGPRNPPGGGPYDRLACGQEPAPECKPDFAGPDWVSTASYDPGQYVFSGTSAAAPHVAGAAALVKGAYFPWGPAEIHDFLKNHALQPDGSSVSRHTMAVGTQQDPGWGWGRSWLGNPPAAIAVGVAHLGASAEGCAIRVEWQTGAEVGILGFDIYRSNAASEQYLVLNKELVPSVSSSAPPGAAYTLWDRNVEPGRTYWYKLQAVDARGQDALYGPVEATALHCLALPLITSD
jgi:hypothetical protein